MTNKHPDFRMPVATKVKARTATMTNAFVNHVIPAIRPSNEDIDEALGVLGMSDGICCAYCGDRCQEWDHLNPVVQDKRPSGFITEIQNLIPACKACNASKSNSPWREWILGTATASPARRGVADLEQRIEAIERYTTWRPVTQVDFEGTLGPGVWDTYWEHHALVIEAMEKAHVEAEFIRAALADEYVPRRARSASVEASSGTKNVRYIVMTPEGETGELSKTQAVLEIVAAMASLGVECSAIADVVGHRAFKSVDGNIADDAVWDAFVLRHPMKNPDHRKWFADRPIRQHGAMWVLARNTWGPDTERRMDELISFAPDPIAYRRSADGADSTPSKEVH